ncbi:hypothetical protein QWY85_12905 [Neolewinella lacunae]|uniref:T9SS C-terminal target domain-containing protein n=1 Tax=Neolewinella lacunae TaxID=1517758 RepID=A0A923PP76_9BACT|nr:hypothetical protein [Neolewinella lacunae]MBC6995266.1 hypothetical protein [Neolewinella lacunae]MDN3635565.1 hypothetical protein [Neolewinella lacunae]
MRIKQLILSLLLLAGFTAPLVVQAHIGPGNNRPANRSEQERIQLRSNCDNAVAQIDMEINNVRARLTTGGDVWWDGSNGRYVVPKPPPGVPEVSSIFAGAVWLGGRDPGGGLKVAAQDYGRSTGNFDYYPGPLTDEGTISRDTCARWDRFFVVKGQSIREVRAAYQIALESNTLPLDLSQIPADVLGWPSTGNPYFFDVNGFELPNTFQGLAGFWDEDLDGIYDPTLGDYPIIEIRGCSETPQFPEEMTFWIYNDAGNTHRQSGTPLQIQMEIQVQAFAYSTSDDINSMTFQRYKLINRAQEDILDTYFAMWVDPDLGCFRDDYVGSDTSRSLAYVYNEDELDGSNGCTCEQGINTYCDEIPILGVDYFRGPRAPIFDDDGNPIGEEELGMSSFIYINNAGVGGPPPATTDPNTAEEYYNYLQGIWRDGSPLYNSGNGYDIPGGVETRYAFSDAPDNAAGWSMATADLPFGDRRTLQASGPFTLTPGAVNELIIGVVWVPDQTHPNPSIQRLQQADDLAQSLFNNCFDLLEGPDAPDVDLIELDREIILLWSNGPASNNFEEKYFEPGLGIPSGFDSLYRFEGYRIFQLSGPSAILDPDDPSQAREIAQYDLKNGVTKVFNWNAVEGENNPLITPFLVPSLRVEGANTGIRRSISITQDAFASGGETRLINHRRYYFVIIAYGYNNYKEYDPFDQDNPGQPRQYLPSSRNIGEQGNDYYLAIPRPILDRTLSANYGDGAVITRLSGTGNNGNFLDLDDATAEKVESDFAAGETQTPELTYKIGAGPIEVFVANPLDVVDGEYELTFFDENMANTRLDDTVRWMLRCLDGCSVPTIISKRPIADVNEQVIGEFGFSVLLGDAPEPGEEPLGDNGAIGGSITYADPENPWLGFIPDNFSPGIGIAQLDQALFDYVSTENFARFSEEDPNQRYSNLFPGIYPFKLMDWLPKENTIPYISPVWLSAANSLTSAANGLSLANLNNVDIVLTPNKDLWSRCVVIETASHYQAGEVVAGEALTTEGGARMFDSRPARSVTKEAGPDGLPVPVDGSVDPDLATGLAYFPGYAVDVETGQRLEIFWGENTIYDGRTVGPDNFELQDNGRDMIWNPSSVIIDPIAGSGLSLADFVTGGQHFFYVTNRPYDGGEYLLGRFDGTRAVTRKRLGIEAITWAGFPVLLPGTSLLSYADGLIPNEARIKLRVNNKYGYAEGTEDSNGYPTYRFSIDGKAANTNLDETEVARALEMINVVPNPYYAYSIYEDDQFETNVKITNLPARATVTIYSLDGKFIRKYDRDEVARPTPGEGRFVKSRQITPALEWDLRNYRGIPVASGVYLIHVAAPGLGERTLKFFGVQRQFDPSGL